MAGKRKTEAARAAGFSEPMALNAKQKIESRPSVRDLFSELCRKAKITDALLARRMREGLDATTVSKETRYAEREVLASFSERREMLSLILHGRGLLTDKVELDVGENLARVLTERVARARERLGKSGEPRGKPGNDDAAG